VNNKLKKFWVSDTGLGRDIFVFQATDKNELENFFILQHNVDVEHDIKFEGRSHFEKVKTFKECKFIIFEELTKEEYEDDLDFYDSSMQFDRIKDEYELDNYSNEELIEISFHDMKVRTIDHLIRAWNKESLSKN
jgi:hypothetical protein